MIEYAVLDTRFPRAVVNLITSEHPLPVLRVMMAEFYPGHRYQIVAAAEVPKRLISRYLRVKRYPQFPV